MKYYVLTDKVAECQKKLSKVFKKLDKEPLVTYSQPMQKIHQTTVTDEFGSDTYKTIVDVVEVTIENFAFNDWTIVAQVRHQDGYQTIYDGKYYKDIPNKFGLNYNRCDHCGKVHPNRIESYIIFNTQKKEWMQVGSSCVDKMFAYGKYMRKVFIDLHEFFTVKCGGTDEFSFGGWNIPDTYKHKAITFRFALATCKSYYDNISKEWVKVRWEQHIRIDGTNDHLMNHSSKIKEDDVLANEPLYTQVANYVTTLEGGVDEYSNEPTFQQRMKDAIVNEYIKLCDIYLAWFAMTGYYQSLNRIDFVGKLKQYGIVVGEKINFVGKLKKIKEDRVWNEYWQCDEDIMTAILVDRNGIEYRKQISNEYVIEPYKIGGGDEYEFTCKVKYIPQKSSYVGLGGRLSKTKKRK